MPGTPRLGHVALRPHSSCTSRVLHTTTGTYLLAEFLRTISSPLIPIHMKIPGRFARWFSIKPRHTSKPWSGFIVNNSPIAMLCSRTRLHRGDTQGRRRYVTFALLSLIDPKSCLSQLYHRRRDIALFHPQMGPQRRMLEALGINGMSSDEEVTTPQGVKYFILAPRWRAPVITPWLRVFDSLYLRHRYQAAYGDQRGCMPHERSGCTKQSTSSMFVPGLPINAYRPDWLEQQLDVTNVVHPSARQSYTHDPQLAQCVLIPPIPLLIRFTSC